MNLRPHIFPKESPSYKIDYRETNAREILASRIYRFLPDRHEQPLFVVCIGTDRSTGDALGPLVGSKLQQQQPASYHVYGTLEKPVHAVNMEGVLAKITAHHPHAYILGIDASLGKSDNVGKISLGSGPIQPGAGVKKQLPSVGDAHLTGIVNICGQMAYVVLQNTRLHLVTQMADTLANSLHTACLRRENARPPRKPAMPSL